MDDSIPHIPAFRLDGARILITGAAGGIGSATARLCGQMGAKLVLTDIAPAARTQAMAQDMKGVDAVFACDTSDRHAVEDMVSRAGPFSAMVDSAAICPYVEDWMAPEFDEAEIMRVMRVNVLGPINVVRAVLPGMIEHKYGRIALCGSIAGWSGGLRAAPHYSASKGAVHALVRWISQRAVSHGVTVNAVAPGPVLTGMTQGQAYDPELYPMKRMGHPEEIASALAFLCSPGASYLSGTIIDVNGGTHLR